jgi:hypothetical protein
VYLGTVENSAESVFPIMLFYFYGLQVRKFPTLRLNWSGGYGFVESVKTTVENSIEKKRFSLLGREAFLFLRSELFRI